VAYLQFLAPEGHVVASQQNLTKTAYRHINRVSGLLTFLGVAALVAALLIIVLGWDISLGPVKMSKENAFFIALIVGVILMGIGTIKGKNGYTETPGRTN
jgi:hypothetical protein